VGVSLRKQGAGRGAVVSFLISTPQTGVDSILVTLGMLGPALAVIRPVAAFVTGVLGGAAANLAGGEDPPSAVEPRRCDSCEEMHRKSWLWRALEYGLVTLPRDTAGYLVVGLLAAAAITVAMPEGLLQGRLGTGLTGMLVMMLVGLPMYVCASASVPIAAALVAKGASLGAALVFLMTGPATNVATMVAVWRTLGRRALAVYLGSIAAGSVAFGLVLDAVSGPAVLPAAHAGHAAHAMMPAWLGHASAVTMVALMAWAFISRRLAARRRAASGEGGAGPGTLEFSVGGMTCEHCAGSVKRAVESVAGVASAEVNLGLGRLLVRGAGLNARLVEEAVQLAGYSVKAAGRAEGGACACSSHGGHGADGHDCGCGGHG